MGAGRCGNSVQYSLLNNDNEEKAGEFFTLGETHFFEKKYFRFVCT